MNQKKISVYKEVLKDVSVTFNGAKKIIEEEIEETCSREKLCVEKVIYFVY